MHIIFFLHIKSFLCRCGVIDIIRVQPFTADIDLRFAIFLSAGL